MGSAEAGIERYALITPAKNEEAFIAGAIDSILAQPQGAIGFRRTPGVKEVRDHPPVFLPRRDLNHETGPNGDIVFHVNITLVVGDDPAGDGESEACTASLRGEIR